MIPKEYCANSALLLVVAPFSMDRDMVSGSACDPTQQWATLAANDLCRRVHMTSDVDNAQLTCGHGLLTNFWSSLRSVVEPLQCNREIKGCLETMIYLTRRSRYEVSRDSS